MKQLLLLLCIFLSINIKAQVKDKFVDMDKVEENGTRIIVTKGSHLYDYKLIYAASAQLSYMELPNHESIYYIRLNLNEGKRYIEKGRKLLLKFEDDSIMELENTNEIDELKNELRTFGKTSFIVVTPDYKVTEEQLRKIINNKVVKLRIEDDLGFMDRNIKNNKFSNGIKKAFDAILNQKKIKNDIYEGF